MVAIVDIVRNGGLRTNGRQRFDGRDVDVATHLLEGLLARLQAEGKLRSDFDPRVMAVAIRAAIDAVPYRIVLDPGLDVDHCAREIATIFDLATRARTEGQRAVGVAVPNERSSRRHPLIVGCSEYRSARSASHWHEHGIGDRASPYLGKNIKLNPSAR